MQRSTLSWAIVPYAVVAIVHVLALAIGSNVTDFSKLLLMPLLAIPVLQRLTRIPNVAAVLLLGALLFSWLGDSAGAFFPGDAELPVMLSAFGIAHLAYITLFVRYLGQGRMPRWTLVFAAWWILLIVMLGPHTGALLIPVALYGIVLATTAATAARCSRMVAAGAAFFLASDTILAFRLFVPETMPAGTDVLVMLTYTLGQGLIVFGTLMSIKQKDITRR